MIESARDMRMLACTSMILVMIISMVLQSLVLIGVQRAATTWSMDGGKRVRRLIFLGWNI